MDELLDFILDVAIDAAVDVLIEDLSDQWILYFYIGIEL